MKKTPLQTKIKYILIWVLYFIVLALLYIYLKRPMHFVVPSFIILLTVLEFVMKAASGKTLGINISVEGDNSKNKKALVRLEFNNKSFVPIMFLEAKVQAENLLNGEKKEITQVLSVFSKRKENISFFVLPKYCGYIRFRILYIKKGGILGILKEKISLDREAHYTVLPDIPELSVDKERIFSYSMESFKYSLTKTGNDPGEIFGIKDYQQGDSLKTIHWKLSSKMDSLVIRQMGYPVDNDILIILDKIHDDINKDSIEKLTELLFSVSSYLSSEYVKYDIGWYDSNLREFVIVQVRAFEEWLSTCIQTLSVENVRYSGISSIRIYTLTEKEKQYSNYILISNDMRDKELLSGYGNVIEFSEK